MSNTWIRTGMAAALALVLLGLSTGCGGKKKARAVQSYVSTSQSYYEGALALEKRNLRKANTCFERMTSEEIGDRLGVSPTAARMLLSRARRRLDGLLKPLLGAAQRDA